MLGNRVLAGAAWLVGARLSTRVLDILAMLVVARILSPQDFGLFALASTTLLILSAASDLSLSNALVQMKDPPAEAYDTAFTLGVLRGALITALLAASAWPLAAIYADPRLVPVTLALAAAPLARGFVSPRMADFDRALNFRPAFIVEAAAKAATFVVSIAIAFAVENYWALIGAMIASAVMSTALSYVFAPYRPKPKLSHWRPIFSFSGWLAVGQTVSTLNMQADRFFVGKSLGTPALGQYSLGNTLASLPTEATVAPMMQALYAGFSKLTHDLPRFRAAYLASQAIVMSVAMPLGFLASVLAYPVIELTLGEKWREAAFVIMVLAPVISLQILTTAAGAVCMATGRTKEIFVRDVLALSARLPLILIGLYLGGFHGVVWARVISGLVFIFLNVQIVTKILGIPLAEQIRTPWRSIASSLAMAAVLVLVQILLPFSAGGFRLFAEIAFSAGLGIGIYVACHAALWLLAGKPAGPERRLVESLARFVEAARRPRRRRYAGK